MLTNVFVELFNIIKPDLCVLHALYDIQSMLPCSDEAKKFGTFRVEETVVLVCHLKQTNVFFVKIPEDFKSVGEIVVIPCGG